MTKTKTKQREYAIWAGMKSRCENRRSTSFPHYGGRGITVCQRWRESFDAFLADMGPRPSSKHSIERKDNNGNYEMGNCRWATRAEQASNTRDVILVTHGGLTLTQSEWARRCRVTAGTLAYRLDWLPSDVALAYVGPIPRKVWTEHRKRQYRPLSRYRQLRVRPAA